MPDELRNRLGFHAIWIVGMAFTALSQGLCTEAAPPASMATEALARQTNSIQTPTEAARSQTTSLSARSVIPPVIPNASSAGRLPAAHLSDGRLQQTVRWLLQSDPRTATFAEQVTVHDGQAKLEGLAYSQRDRELAQKKAARVRGLKGIQNLIVVAPNADLEIAQKIRQRFSQDPIVDAMTVGVTVIHGKVFLCGEAKSQVEMEKVTEIACHVSGVISVSNGLEVSPGIRSRTIRNFASGRSFPTYRAVAR